MLELEQQKQDLEIELIYFNDPDLEKSDIVMVEAGKLFEKKKNANRKAMSPQLMFLLISLF